MITDDHSLAAAAARIEFFLEHPPHEGTPQDAEFADLLEAVAQYQSALQADRTKPDGTESAGRVSELMRKAAALGKRRDAETRPHWSSLPEDGEGIGPTTGV